MNNRYTYLLLCFCLPLLLGAQEASPSEAYLEEEIYKREFSKSDWEAAKSGIDYSDEQVRVDRRDEDFEEIQDSTQNRRAQGSRSYTNAGSTIFKALLVMGGIALLAFIISRFMGAGGIGFRRNRKIKDQNIEFSLEQIENKLLETDVQRMNRLALESENYPLALRLLYLEIIKTLSLNGYTKWKREKTNRQYIREIEDTGLKSKFRNITRVYERLWYGRGAISKSDYELLEPNFTAFMKTISARKIKTEVDG